MWCVPLHLLLTKFLVGDDNEINLKTNQHSKKGYHFTRPYQNLRLSTFSHGRPYSTQRMQLDPFTLIRPC